MKFALLDYLENQRNLFDPWEIAHAFLPYADLSK